MRTTSYSDVSFEIFKFFFIPTTYMSVVGRTGIYIGMILGVSAVVEKRFITNRFISGSGVGATSISTRRAKQYRSEYQPPTEPSPPFITGVTLNGTELRVAFFQNKDGGSPILWYMYSLDGGVTFFLLNLPYTSYLAITGVSTGAVYNVVIKTVNAIGISNPSNSFRISTYDSSGSIRVSTPTTFGNYLTVPASSAFDFGTGNYTIEGWVYMVTQPGRSTIFYMQSASGATQFSLGFTPLAGQWRLRVNNGTIGGVNIATNAILPILNMWTHFVIMHSTAGNGGVGGTYLFINGVGQLNYQASPSSGYSDAVMTIGSEYGGGNQGDFYLSNFRVVKGYTLYPYTTNFTPPTTSLQKVAGTQLLLKMKYDQPLKDESDNNFTLTTTGSLSHSDFDPFAAISSPFFIASEPL
jgi:hypothetical protein